MNRPLIKILVLLTLALATTSARACPSCYSPNDKSAASSNKTWPLLTATAVMLVLPIGMAGGLCLWLRRSSAPKRKSSTDFTDCTD